MAGGEATAVEAGLTSRGNLDSPGGLPYWEAYASRSPGKLALGWVERSAVPTGPEGTTLRLLAPVAAEDEGGPVIGWRLLLVGRLFDDPYAPLVMAAQDRQLSLAEGFDPTEAAA